MLLRFRSVHLVFSSCTVYQHHRIQILTTQPRVVFCRIQYQSALHFPPIPYRPSRINMPHSKLPVQARKSHSDTPAPLRRSYKKQSKQALVTIRLNTSPVTSWRHQSFLARMGSAVCNFKLSAFRDGRIDGSEIWAPDECVCGVVTWACTECKSNVGLVRRTGESQMQLLL